jgi:protease I
MEVFMTKKILFLTGDYAEDYETMVPFQMLTMVGYEVHAVCPNKKKGEKVMTAIHDFNGEQTYSEKPGHMFELNYNFSDVNLKDYDGLVIAGGRAPEYLRLDGRVIEAVQSFANSNKPIAAVCHGVQLLTAANVIEGKKITGYPACAPEITLAKATYVKTEMNEAVIDGNFVTAPAWPAHPKWMASFLKVLGAKITI